MSGIVFISYSSVDREPVQTLAKALDAVPVPYFLDQKEIRWGDDITEKIGRGLAECSALIVVLSPASVKSQWVPFEIGQAVSLGKRVLPFLTHPSVEIPAFLRRFHYETSIEGVTSFFRSASIALGGQDRVIGPKEPERGEEDKPFDKSAAAEHIMSALIEGFACRINEEPDSGKQELIRQDFHEKLSGLGDRYRMPSEVRSMYLDFLLDNKSYRPVHEFIATLQNPDVIKSWPTEQGKIVVGWLFKNVFGDEYSNGDSEDNNT